MPFAVHVLNYNSFLINVSPLFPSRTSVAVIGAVVDAEVAEVVTPAAKRAQEKKKKATIMLSLSRNVKHLLQRHRTSHPGMSRSSVYRHADMSAAGGFKKRVFSAEFKCRTVAEYGLIPNAKARKRFLSEQQLKPCIISKWKKQLISHEDPHPCGICSSVNVGVKFYTCVNSQCSVNYCRLCLQRLFLRDVREPPVIISCANCRANIESFHSTLSQVPVELLKELVLSSSANTKSDIKGHHHKIVALQTQLVQ